MVRAMYGVLLKNRKGSTVLMCLLGLDGTIDQLAMASSVCWHGHVFRRADVHVFRMAFHFEIEGQGKKGRPKRTWKKQVDEEGVKVGLRRKDAVCRSKWSVGIGMIAAELR